MVENWREVKEKKSGESTEGRFGALTYEDLMRRTSKWFNAIVTVHTGGSFSLLIVKIIINELAVAAVLNRSCIH
ncbi:hypothetical protein M5K25_010169 [Dendrobium thyrsiflorum]|uniref:Uncharacterized protein n=1 Tax=Dendrobium thyrsiflorum TaxID=117978 RepID=A0ABD0UZF7_DENTH